MCLPEYTRERITRASGMVGWEKEGSFVQSRQQIHGGYNTSQFAQSGKSCSTRVFRATYLQICRTYVDIYVQESVKLKWLGDMKRSESRRRS